MNIKIYASLNSMREAYKSKLKKTGIDYWFASVLVEGIEVYNAFYERLNHDIYVNLHNIYNDFKINLEEKIIETIIHESLHYVLHNEIEIPITIRNKDNQTFHHAIINSMGFFKKVKPDRVLE